MFTTDEEEFMQREAEARQEQLAEREESREDDENHPPLPRG